MKYIVCVDDNLGIKFNKRRVSKDLEIVNDIINFTKGNLYVDEPSRDLFEYYSMNNYYTEKYTDNYNFVERDIDENEVSELVVYYFNRKYPSDVKLNVDLSKFYIDSEYEFLGKSHELLTRKVYKRVEK